MKIEKCKLQIGTSLWRKPNALGYNLGMPVIWREAGFEFRIYTEDHKPPHTHAMKGGTEAVINFGDDRASPHIRDIFRMKPKDARRALDITIREQGYFLEKWREIHDRR